MNAQVLIETAKAMVPPGRGILAADESTRSTEKRFKKFDIPHTAETRRAYRIMMFTTPGLEKFISGVIMYDESLGQTAPDGKPFPKYLADKGIVPGVKVDTGFYPMAGFPGEFVTEGLDGLRERLAEYKQLGARFAKWRAVIAIDEILPSSTCIKAQAHGLARYAALCQEADIVPIVEPDVLLAGSHTLQRCEEVSKRVLEAVYHELFNMGVLLEGTILKPNMVTPGKDCPAQASPQQVAEATVRTLRNTVPAVVPGIAFLSGGQGSVPATANLDAINRLGPHPWEVTFSYLRALADPAFGVWQGRPENLEAAQRVFLHRASMLAAARRASYRPEMEK